MSIILHIIVGYYVNQMEHSGSTVDVGVAQLVNKIVSKLEALDRYKMEAVAHLFNASYIQKDTSVAMPLRGSCSLVQPVVVLSMA